MHLALWQFFGSEQWQILLAAQQIAQARNYKIYAVGGLVRDGLMASLSGNLPRNLPRNLSGKFSDASSNTFANTNANNKFTPLDLDLVVGGGNMAGIEVAKALHSAFVETRLQIFPKFQTARLEFNLKFENLKSESQELGNLEFALDFATARTEFYEYPGANPQVQASSIDQDLGRRDFTINAFALEIGSTEVIDLFGGYQDLINQKIRAIRPGSFAEDPRRIFRAARFAVRFGFEIYSETAAEIKAVTASGLHDCLGGSRLKAEIRYIFTQLINPSKAAAALFLLADLGGLSCIDPRLILPENLSLHLRRLRRWLGWFQPEILFEAAAEKLVLTYLLPELTPVSQKLEACVLPSAIVRELRKYSVLDLIIFAVKLNSPNSSDSSDSSNSLRRKIWQYLTKWQHQKPLLSGTDLRQIGCLEGKTMGILLTKINNASLDGRISTKAEAVIFAEKLIKSENLPAKL